MTKLRVLQNARAKSLTSTRHKQMFSMKPFGRVNSEEKISINILCLKMCSLCGGDFRNQLSVFGLYVMPTHF